MNVTVGQAADAVGKTEDAKGHDQDMMGRLGKPLSAQPDMPAAQAASQNPSTSAASQQQPPLNSSKQVSALSPMTTPGIVSDTRKVHHEGVDLFEGEKSVDAQAAHPGTTTPGGSLVSILQGRKRKAPDTAGDFSPGVHFCCSLNSHISDVQLYFDLPYLCSTHSYLFLLHARVLSCSKHALAKKQPAYPSYAALAGPAG